MTDLCTIYKNCKGVKKLANNVQVEFDTVKQDVFSIYSQEKNQQAHDAGYDAYMTGFSFISIAKYIEIGNVCMKDGVTIAQASSQSSILSQHTVAKAKEASKTKKAAKPEEEEKKGKTKK